jgi:hypothetical protein
MRLYFILTTLLLLSGCETIQVAKRDFDNFKKTVVVNAKCKAVYNSNHF